MPVLTSAPSRRDGAKLWPFHVLGVVENPPWARGGLVMANYDYYDRTRPLAQVGQVGQLFVLLKDPGSRPRFYRPRLSGYSPIPPIRPGWLPTRCRRRWRGIYRFNIPLLTEGVSAAGLFMILFLIANAIAQSVRERVRRICGSEDAWDFPMRGVMALVFVEAAIPCLLGALVGFAIAKVLASKIASLERAAKNGGGAPPTLSPGVLAIAFGFAALVAFAGAAMPAWRMRRLDIAAALRR